MFYSRYYWYKTTLCKSKLNKLPEKQSKLYRRVSTWLFPTMSVFPSLIWIFIFKVTPQPFHSLKASMYTLYTYRLKNWWQIFGLGAIMGFRFLLTPASLGDKKQRGTMPFEIRVRDETQLPERCLRGWWQAGIGWYEGWSRAVATTDGGGQERRLPIRGRRDGKRIMMSSRAR